MNKHSIWKDTVTMPSYPVLHQNVKTDTLIIGGGLTGLLCGHFLKAQGRDYILIDQNRIASHTTANTTAKITTQHGLIYSKLLRHRGKEVAAGYYQANREALQRLTELAMSVNCDYEEMPNLIYDMHSPKAIEDEIMALEELGAKAYYVEKPENLPFTPNASLMTLEQGQFHPLKFAAAIASPQEGHIYENTKALDLEKENIGYQISTDTGASIRAKSIIIATHFPFKNMRGLYFVKMYQSRSYALLLGDIKEEQFLPYMAMGSREKDFSFRRYRNRLIIGGCGGKTGNDLYGLARLKQSAKEFYPESSILQSWAAQDCMTLDQMPYIGDYCPGYPNIKVATGYNKWGMTSAMAAALALTGQMDKEVTAIFDPHRSIAHPQLFINLASSAANLLKLKQPRCSHMGCALKWNRSEQSWDCPCHGSRFDKNGLILNEPAEKNIKTSRF